MVKRRVYHILPDTEGRVWKVRREASERAVRVQKTKDAAEKAAMKLAKERALTQVVTHGRDGKVLEEHSYGEDPKAGDRTGR
jgi:hypothetical protein